MALTLILVFVVCQEESLFVTSVVSGLWSGEWECFANVRGVMVGNCPMHVRETSHYSSLKRLKVPGSSSLRSPHSSFETQTVCYSFSHSLTAPDCSWQLLAAPDSSWQLLTAPDCSWQLLAAPDRSWLLLTALDSLLLLLAALYSSW